MNKPCENPSRLNLWKTVGNGSVVGSFAKSQQKCTENIKNAIWYGEFNQTDELNYCYINY
jgi:hypothetical protein